MSDEHRIASIDDLEARFGQPPERSLLKEIPALTAAYRRFIDLAPFYALTTVGPEGTDCSPRGDAAPAVHVVDDRTLHLPDRRGNNRIDSLRNIVRDGRVSLLLLVPGATECMRVNGMATLTADPELLSAYAVAGNEPNLVIEVVIGSVYFQCARALKRSRLWDPDVRVDPADVPTAGTMSQSAIDHRRAAGQRIETSFDPDAYDAELAARQAATLY